MKIEMSLFLWITTGTSCQKWISDIFNFSTHPTVYREALQLKKTCKCGWWGVEAEKIKLAGVSAELGNISPTNLCKKNLVITGMMKYIIISATNYEYEK